MVFADYPILRNEQELPLYLDNMGLHTCQDHMIRPEGYSNPQVLYCTRGSGMLITDGKKTLVPTNSAVFLPAEYPHEYYADGDVWDIHWVVPGGYAALDILNKLGFSEPGVFALSDVRMLDHIFRKMHDALRTDSIFGNFRASGFLYDFLIELYRQISSAGARPDYSPPLTRALEYINLHFAEQITLDDLCRASGVSKQHLCLLFRRILDLRPMEYIARRRIQEAKSLLTGSVSSIELIAEKTGFCSESYFCKLFKKYEGITPGAFRSER